MKLTLIDAGPLIAYFDRADQWHAQASEFLDTCKDQLTTTTAVITEVMWHLRSDYRVQNELLRLVSLSIIKDEPLTAGDFVRIAELNKEYSDVEADFADLSLLAIAERLNIHNIVSIDHEFDFYRCRRGHKKTALKRISLGA